jgi:quinol monooxygenase YgiN
MTPSDEAFDFDYLAKWLGAVADASAQGEVTNEAELPDGRYLVAEEWPSRAAFLEHLTNLETLKAMIALSRLPA